MAGWLDRLIGRAPVPADGPAPRASSAPTPPVSRSLPAGDTARLGGRRALLAPGGAIAGFEIGLPAMPSARLRAQPDSPAAAAYGALLCGALKAVRDEGREALGSLPAAVLERAAVADSLPTGAMLLADPPAQEAQARAAVQAARSRGVRIGVTAVAPEAAGEADFVVLRAEGDDVESLLLAAERWLHARPGVPRIALGLPDLESVERALAGGFALAGGRLERSAGPRSPRPLSPAAHRICVLMNDLALDRDAARVAETIRGDVGLSYRLLRYANSPALGLARRVESLEQALALLGRDELRRWLSMLLLGAVQGRQASRALQEVALSRARLMECLARSQGSGPPDVLFATGLLSLLDQLLEMPLAEALAPLNLTPPAREALLERAGPWAGHLALVEALERDDPDAFERLAVPLGGADAAMACAEEAWRWAALATRELVA